MIFLKNYFSAKHFLRNVALGILLGVVLTLLLAWLYDTEVRESIAKFYTFIFSAVLSLLAAGLTLVGVFSSIENQQNLVRQQRLGKLKSARAFLPSALSRMCRVSEAGMRYSHQFEHHLKELGPDAFAKESLNELAFPEELVGIFRDVIDLTDDPIVADRLAAVISEHQVFLARWNSEFPRGNDQIDPEHYTLERTVGWALLYAIVSSVFEFARGESTQIEETDIEQGIRSALHTTATFGLGGPKFDKIVSTYAQSFKKRSQK